MWASLCQYSTYSFQHVIKEKKMSWEQGPHVSDAYIKMPKNSKQYNRWVLQMIEGTLQQQTSCGSVTVYICVLPFSGQPERRQMLVCVWTSWVWASRIQTRFPGTHSLKQNTSLHRISIANLAPDASAKLTRSRKVLRRGPFRGAGMVHLTADSTPLSSSL